MYGALWGRDLRRYATLVVAVRESCALPRGQDACTRGSGAQRLRVTSSGRHTDPRRLVLFQLEFLEAAGSKASRDLSTFPAAAAGWMPVCARRVGCFGPQAGHES